ncbi:MAG: DUF2442 domain-containing protein [Pricia sp.]
MKVVKVYFTETKVFLSMADGRDMGCPQQWFPAFEKATEAQKENYTILPQGIGVHWPDLDIDLSAEGMLSYTGKPEPLIEGPYRPDRFFSIIRYLINKQYPSRRQFAQEFGIKAQNLHKYFSGERVPSFKTFQEMAENLGYEVLVKLVKKEESDRLLQVGEPESRYGNDKISEES